MPEEILPEIPQEPSKPIEHSAPAQGPEMAPRVPEASSEQRGERLEGKYLEILHKAAPAMSPPAAKAEEVATTAKSIGALTDEDTKVTRLLELAEQKGVEQAVKVAYALKDYYVLDRMHDELADKFYLGLQEKGLAPKE